MLVGFPTLGENRGHLFWEDGLLNDPEHWLQRAREARTLADQMSKETMLKIAADFEHLAERAALRAQGASPPRPKGSSPAG
jgi:hypothetical protein